MAISGDCELPAGIANNSNCQQSLTMSTYVSKPNIHVDIVILSSISPAEQTIPAALLAMQAYIVHVSFLLIVGLTTMHVQVGVACVM